MHTLVDRGAGTPLSSVYVHVPFCRDRCSYCAFATVADDPQLHARTTRALLTELSRHAPEQSWRTIYLGGGTPSLLAPELLDELLSGLRAATPDGPAPEEITLEANPANVTRERLASWAALGVTRVSLGVQTFHDEALRRLGRLHDAAGARAALELLATDWPGTWSADLLLGWEHQQPELLDADLAALAEFRPPHLSAYPLEIEPGSQISHAVQNNRINTSKISHLHIDAHRHATHLEPAELRRYEVSNFARAGHESRHNRVYWANAEYLGLGPGACSSRGRLRWANRRDTRDWLARVEAGRDARARAERIAPAQRLLESLAVGLRTEDGVSTPGLDARFGDDWRRVLHDAAGVPLEQLGFEERDDHLLLAGDARLRADAVMAHLARSWPDDPPSHP